MRAPKSVSKGSPGQERGTILDGPTVGPFSSAVAKGGGGRGLPRRACCRRGDERILGAPSGGMHRAESPGDCTVAPRGGADLRILHLAAAPGRANVAPGCQPVRERTWIGANRRATARSYLEDEPTFAPCTLPRRLGGSSRMRAVQARRRSSAGTRARRSVGDPHASSWGSFLDAFRGTDSPLAPDRPGRLPERDLGIKPGRGLLLASALLDGRGPRCSGRRAHRAPVPLRSHDVRGDRPSVA